MDQVTIVNPADVYQDLSCCIGDINFTKYIQYLDAESLEECVETRIAISDRSLRYYLDKVPKLIDGFSPDTRINGSTLKEFLKEHNATYIETITDYSTQPDCSDITKPSYMYVGEYHVSSVNDDGVVTHKYALTIRQSLAHYKLLLYNITNYRSTYGNDYSGGFVKIDNINDELFHEWRLTQKIGSNLDVRFSNYETYNRVLIECMLKDGSNWLEVNGDSNEFIRAILKHTTGKYFYMSIRDTVKFLKYAIAHYEYCCKMEQMHIFISRSSEDGFDKLVGNDNSFLKNLLIDTLCLKKEYNENKHILSADKYNTYTLGSVLFHDIDKGIVVEEKANTKPSWMMQTCRMWMYLQPFSHLLHLTSSLKDNELNYTVTMTV